MAVTIFHKVMNKITIINNGSRKVDVTLQERLHGRRVTKDVRR